MFNGCVYGCVYGPAIACLLAVSSSFRCPFSCFACFDRKSSFKDSDCVLRTREIMRVYGFVRGSLGLCNLGCF